MHYNSRHGVLLLRQALCIHAAYFIVKACSMEHRAWTSTPLLHLRAEELIQLKQRFELRLSCMVRSSVLYYWR